MTPDPIRAALERAASDLQEARDAVSEWGAYASKYFQEKHDLAGELMRIDAQIDRARAALAAAPPEPVGELVRSPFTVEQLRDQWNAQADEFNQWESLGLDEQIGWAQARAAALIEQQAATIAALSAVPPEPEPVAVPGEQYHEDIGPVTWWRFPIEEPPYCGTPNDSDWPGYHTHFTPLPPLPQPADAGES